MIDFIVANYIYFLIGFAALVLIIIGFIAEKTDFGHKKKNKNKPAENVIKEEKAVVQVEQSEEQPAADTMQFEEIKVGTKVPEKPKVAVEEVKKDEEVKPLPVQEEPKEELSFGDLTFDDQEIEEQPVTNDEENNKTDELVILNPKANEEINKIEEDVSKEEEPKEKPVVDLNANEEKKEDTPDNIEGTSIDEASPNISNSEEELKSDNDALTFEDTDAEEVTPDDYYAKELPEVKEAENVKPEISEFELPSIGEPKKEQLAEEEDNIEDIWKF